MPLLDPTPQIEQNLKNILNLTGGWSNLTDANYGNTGVDKFGPNRWVGTGTKGTICYLNNPDNQHLTTTERDQIFDFIAGAPQVIRTLIDAVRQRDGEIARLT